MPHAFKANPDHPAIDYLVRLHADLGGKIWENKKEAQRLAEAMKHVEAVIRLFDPNFNIRRISIRRRYKGNAWFKRGTLFRHALDVLRKTQEPLTTRQIVKRMLAARNVRNVASRDVSNLAASALASLRHNDGKTVRQVGRETPGRWKAVYGSTNA
jgi:hypothetical protein